MSSLASDSNNSADEFNKTLKGVTNAMMIIPIVLGVTAVVVVAIIIACYCRSQRVKQKNAALLAQATAVQRQDELRAERHQTPTSVQHVVLVSPTAPTYNSSVVSGGPSAIPYAMVHPSAPTADLDDQQIALEIQLQQRELDRYARERAAPPQPMRSPVYQQPRPHPPMYQPQPPLPPPLPQQQYQQSRPPLLGSTPVQQQQPQPWDDDVFVASRIPMDALFTTTLISRGGFGEVYKGSYRGQTVAIKKLLPETRRDLKQIAGFFAEIKLMATMEHERIVQYVGVAWDALSDACVVTEFMAGGDLRSVLTTFQLLSDGRPQGFDRQKATIALHVAHALTYMHSLQPLVLHRDLKSKNILLDERQWSAKLTDFGVSRERSDHTMTAAVGTVLWMAPEVMAGDRYDDKADVFSFGVVLAELDTHRMPYADVKARMVGDSGRPLPDTALLQRIMAGRVRVSLSDGLREDIRVLALSCVALDPTARPTAAQLLYELHKIVHSL